MFLLRNICSLLFIVTLSCLCAPKGLAQTFYVSPSGNDTDSGSFDKPWRTITKAAAVLTAGQNAIIRGGTYSNEKIIVLNSGSTNGKITFEAYPNETPIIDGSTNSILFDINGKSHITIKGLTLINGKRGIASSTGYIRYITIEGNTVKNMTRPGIALSNASQCVVRDNLLENVVSSEAGECLTFDNTEYIDVFGNEVRNCNTSAVGGEGISMHATKFMRVYNNYVHDMLHSSSPGRPAIYVDGYGGHNESIWIFNNRIERCATGIILAGEFGNSCNKIYIYNNLISDVTEHSAGVVRFGDPAIIGSTPQNQLPDKPWLMTYLNPPMREIVFENNTITRSNWSSSASWSSANKTTGIKIACSTISDIIVQNNIIYNIDFPISQDAGTPPITIRNNFANSRSGTPRTDLGSNSITGDPKFLDSLFRVASDSRTRNSGVAPVCASFDFDFAPRPTTACDIGAHQFLKSGSVALPPNTKPLTRTLTVSLADNSDDAGENATTGEVRLGDSQIQVSGGAIQVGTVAASAPMISAIRFASLNIPKGAAVLKASLSLDLKSVSIAPGKAEFCGVRAEASGNSAPLTAAAFGISSRRLSTTFVNALIKWTGPQSISGLDDIVSEVINRPDWNSGNGITFVLNAYTTTFALRQNSRDAGANFSPKLTVEYVAPANSLSPVLTKAATATPATLTIP